MIERERDDIKLLTEAGLRGGCPLPPPSTLRAAPPPRKSERTAPPNQVPKGRAAEQSCEFIQQGPGHPSLPLPLCPFGTPTPILCSLPLVPAEFHLPLTLDASWPLTSLPCCPHSSPFKCPAPGASPCPPPLLPHLGTHTGKTVAQAPALLTSCSISYNPDAAALGGRGWVCVSFSQSLHPLRPRFPSVCWALSNPCPPPLPLPLHALTQALLWAGRHQNGDA